MKARAVCAASWVLVLAFAASTATAGTGWLEIQKLVEGDGAEVNAFGAVVAISGDVAIATNYQDSDGGLRSGAAYVFRHDGVRWVEEQKLVASDAMGHESFGLAAALSGDLAFIGARGDDDNGSNSGSVYVFRFDGTEWVEEQKLLPSDGEESARFGTAIALRGDEALIGASSDGENPARIGAVYAFRRVADRWVEQQKLVPAEADDEGEFGGSIAISGDLALIGATGETFRAGAAYVYGFDGDRWVEQQKLRPANLVTGSRFGSRVALSGDLALVAAPRDQARSRGSVYYFRYDGTEWHEEQEVRPGDGHDGDGFGSGLALAGDLALVGARGRDAYGFLSGAAYFFRFDGERWVERQQLFASDAQERATFGSDVALSSDTAFVGAPAGLQQQGAVYVFSTKRPRVNLRVDGRESFFVASDLRVRLTLDMTAGPKPLDHYYYWWFGGKYYWITSTGVSTSPAPLATFAPVDLIEAPLYDWFLPPGLWSFGWLMMDGTTLVDRDRVLVLVTPCLGTGTHCEAGPTDILAAPPPSPH